MEIKEELEEAGTQGATRDKDPLNIEISHFNASADYCIFHL